MLLDVMVTFYLSPRMCHSSCEMSRNLILSRLLFGAVKPFKLLLYIDFKEHLSKLHLLLSNVKAL